MIKCRGYEKEGVRMIIRFRNLINVRLNHSDHIRVENCALAHSVGEMDHHVESRSDFKRNFSRQKACQILFFVLNCGEFLQNFIVKGQR